VQYLIVLLRVIHIFASVLWVGGGLFFISVIAPAVREAGQDGGKFMQWVARQGRLSAMFAAASGTTFLSGLILYPLLNYQDRLGTLSGIVLSIGAVFGFLGFLHGLFVTGRLARQMTTLVKEPAAGPPTPEKLQAMQALGAKQNEAAIHSVMLTSLALLFMSASQYLL
jgi:uncharacterized membrane protein